MFITCYRKKLFGEPSGEASHENAAKSDQASSPPENRGPEELCEENGNEIAKDGEVAGSQDQGDARLPDFGDERPLTGSCSDALCSDSGVDGHPSSL